MANPNFEQVKAIVFDLDDTLYPQISYKRSGFNVVSSWLAENQNIDQQKILFELEAILKQFGASYSCMFDRLVEKLALKPTLVPQLVKVFIDHKPNIQCYDGVISMLIRLRKRYRLGILTDGRLSVQKKKIAALGLENRVDEILCSDCLGLEKPAEQLYEWFENKFQIKGNGLMYVGDNPAKDFLGARSRRWFVVRVMTGEVIEEDISTDSCANYQIPKVDYIEKRLIPRKILKTGDR